MIESQSLAIEPSKNILFLLIELYTAHPNITSNISGFKFIYEKVKHFFCLSQLVSLLSSFIFIIYFYHHPQTPHRLPPHLKNYEDLHLPWSRGHTNSSQPTDTSNRYFQRLENQCPGCLGGIVVKTILVSNTVCFSSVYLSFDPVLLELWL